MIPLFLQNFFMGLEANSYSSSLLTTFNLVLNCVPTMAQKWSSNCEASLFSFIRYTQASRLASWTTLRKHWAPEKYLTRYAPYMSQWIKFKKLLALFSLIGKDIWVCLVPKHASRKSHLFLPLLILENLYSASVKGYALICNAMYHMIPPYWLEHLPGKTSSSSISLFSVHSLQSGSS